MPAGWSLPKNSLPEWRAVAWNRGVRDPSCHPDCYDRAMSDEIPSYAPNQHRAIAPRTPKPGEEMWRLQRVGRTRTCELRNDMRAGGLWDVQLFEDRGNRRSAQVRH